MVFAAMWRDREMILWSEVRERQIFYGITYMKNLKYNTNEFISMWLTHIETKLLDTTEERVGEG